MKGAVERTEPALISVEIPTEGHQKEHKREREREREIEKKRLQ